MDVAASHSSDWIDMSSGRMPLDSDFTTSTQPSSATSGWVVDKSSFNPKKIIRFSSLKRGKEEVPISERVKLERVLGLTVNGNASLDSDPVTGAVVYPAGCVIVVYHPRKNKQTHILNASKKTITSLAVSADGKYVVTGECGHQPHVRVWDVLERTQVVEFPGHKFGINCVAFSPNLKYVVSIGTQHDMIVNVWDWRSNVKVASNKVSSKVKAIAFSEDGGYFVTVGNRHVKFWYLEYFRSSKYKEPVPLMGRSAILGEQRNNYFCDVACGKADVADSTYSITKSGLLCEFNNRRLLDKWVELRTTSANCLCVGIDYIFIGCADGIVRCFSPYTLDFITTLPRTHYLGVDVSKGLSIAHMGSHPSSAKYPDTIAITLDETNLKVTCVYNDHSLYVWDIHDIRKVGKSHSFLYHSACIWGVETYPTSLDNALLPPNTFVTCSSDDTVRIWNLDQNMNNETAFKRNVYTSDLLKILYVDEELSYLCEATHSPSGTGEKGDTTYDSRNGVRCIKISPDGRHLASGDRSGNIRIHDIQYVDELCKIEAHDAEVLCLEYSKLDTGHRYLASASRDRLIHVFDMNKDYQFLQTLDDHSSSITAVRFVQRNGQLQMISCGADKSVIFRGAQFKPQLHFSRDNHVVGKTTLYDMEVDVNHKHILTACQDRNIRVYNISNGKHSRTFKGSQGEDGTLIKVVLDNSGLYLATSCTDKNLYVYDFSTGECVATMFGHSEIVTGFRFSNDGKHLISVSGDGCIFYWKLPTEITHSMQVKLADMRSYSAAKQEISRHSYAVPHPVKPSQDSHIANLNMFENAEVAEDGSYRFSVGPLPLWAKKQIADDLPSAPDSGHTQNFAQPQPRGRWAQRIDGQGILVKSIYDSGHVIPYPSQAEVDNLPPELDSYTEAFHKYMDVRRETIIISKQGGQTQDEFEPSAQSLNEIRMRRAASAEVPSGMVTTRRGDSSMSARIRHPTDSTVSSSAQDDYEYDQDGDVADDETDSTEADINEQEVIYYPPFEHDTSFPEGEFKVCNTNPDDLREAHRRNRKVKAERPTDIPLLQVHGVRSTDSEDEDEATTPHSTDRNILSLFSVSTESLDRVGQREKFMQKNFESLDGDKSGEDTENNDNRLSISARFLSTSSSNTPIGKAKKGQELPSPKKLQLLKQMEETRKKLDTIGWKASLNSSKSISDLTHIPEKDFADKSHFHNKGITTVLSDELHAQAMASSMPDLSRTGDSSSSSSTNQDKTNTTSLSARTNSLPRSRRPTTASLAKQVLTHSAWAGKTCTSPSNSGGGPFDATRSHYKYSPRPSRHPLAKKVALHQVLPSRCDTGNSDTIRRASSMSDLSKPIRRLLPSPPSNVTRRPPIRPDSSGNSLRRSSVQHDSNTSSSRIARSSSMSTLAGAGEEDSRLMRPTISSLNKARGSQSDLSGRQQLPKSASSSSLVSGRRDLTYAGSGTSSGETSPTEIKPELPPRTRSASVDRNSKRPSRPEPRVSVSARSNTSMRTTLSTSHSASERDVSKLGHLVNDHTGSNTASGSNGANVTVTKTSKHELFLKRGITASARRVVTVSATSLNSSGTSSPNQMLEKSPQELPVKDTKPDLPDVFTAPLDQYLCEITAESLKLSADNVMQLCKRISMDSDLSEAERLQMLNTLSQAATQAQQTLRPIHLCTGTVQDPVNPRKAPEVPNNGDPMSNLLQQYSDMLLSLVQQRITSQQPPLPFQPNQKE